VRYGGTIGAELFLGYLEGEEGVSGIFERLIQSAQERGQPLLVTLLTVEELVSSLERYGVLTRREIRETVEGILTLPVEMEEKDLILEALELYELSKVPFRDCLILTKAKLEKALPLFTLKENLRTLKEAKVFEVKEG
jgi:predicted nucleic-acid-binding protein